MVALSVVGGGDGFGLSSDARAYANIFYRRTKSNRLHCFGNSDCSPRTKCVSRIVHLFFFFGLVLSPRFPFPLSLRARYSLHSYGSTTKSPLSSVSPVYFTTDPRDPAIYFVTRVCARVRVGVRVRTVILDFAKSSKNPVLQIGKIKRRVSNGIVIVADPYNKEKKNRRTEVYPFSRIVPTTNYINTNEYRKQSFRAIFVHSYNLVVVFLHFFFFFLPSTV